jgi:hypothetical protein
VTVEVERVVKGFGRPLTANWVADPAVSVIVFDVTGAQPAVLNWSVLAPIKPVIARSVKAAEPLVVVCTVVVPPSDPPPVAIATVMTSPH